MQNSGYTSTGGFLVPYSHTPLVPFHPPFADPTYANPYCPPLVHYEQYTFCSYPTQTHSASPFPSTSSAPFTNFATKKRTFNEAEIKTENPTIKKPKIDFPDYSSHFPNYGFYAGMDSSTNNFVHPHSQFLPKNGNINQLFYVILEESISYSNYDNNPIPFGCISNTEFERYKWASNGVNSASSWFQNICTTSEDISEIQKKSLVKKTKNFDNKKVYTKCKNIKEEDPVLPTVIDCQDNSKNDNEPVLCNKLARSVTEIASHLANHHVNALPQHVCYWKDCSRKLAGFKARYKLINHLRVHTGERPYLCKFCNKKFSRTENLKIHERTHTGEKPFKCTVCAKEFANSSDRKKHMHVHSAARSYQCTEIGCPKNYTHPSSLRKHLRNHQKMSTPSESEISGLPEIFEDENNADSEDSSDSGLASVETGNSFIQQNMVLFGCEQTHSNNENAIFNDLQKPSQNMYNNPGILENKNTMLNSHTVI